MNNLKKHPIITTGIIFAVLSVIFNIIWILVFHMAHVYDIIHVFPIIFIYEPIIKLMGGYVTTELIFVPLAFLIDFFIGLLIGWIIRFFVKTESTFLITIIISFAVYWIVITYQWLPII